MTHRHFVGQQALSAWPLNDAADGVARPQNNKWRGAERPKESDAALGNSVTSLQFSGLVMQLELERSKREDADRRLQEETKLQLAQVRDMVKQLQLEQATLRDAMSEVRRMSSQPPRDSVSRDDDLHRVIADRVDELLQRRHKSFFDQDRTARVESAVAEFCRAHIAVEIDRLRGVAREAARSSVDEIVQQRSQEVAATWTNALHQVQEHVMLVAQRSRDAVNAVRERMEGFDDTLRTTQSVVEVQNEKLRGLFDTRALSGELSVCRADIDRVAATLRDRTAEWQSAEAQLRMEVLNIRDSVAEAKTTLGTALARRIDGLAASSATKAELLVAMERATSGVEPLLRENTDSIASIKQVVDTMRVSVDARLKALDDRIARTQETAVRAAETSQGAVLESNSATSQIKVSVEELRQSLSNTAAALQTSVTALSARVPSSDISARITELQERLEMRLSTVDGAVTSRIESIERVLQQTKRELTESVNSIADSASAGNHETREMQIRTAGRYEQRLADITSEIRRSVESLRGEAQQQEALIAERIDEKVTSAVQSAVETALLRGKPQQSKEDANNSELNRRNNEAFAALRSRLDDTEQRLRGLLDDVRRTLLQQDEEIRHAQQQQQDKITVESRKLQQLEARVTARSNEATAAVALIEELRVDHAHLKEQFEPGLDRVRDHVLSQLRVRSGTEDVRHAHTTQQIEELRQRLESLEQVCSKSSTEGMLGQPDRRPAGELAASAIADLHRKILAEIRGELQPLFTSLRSESDENARSMRRMIDEHSARLDALVRQSAPNAGTSCGVSGRGDPQSPPAEVLPKRDTENTNSVVDRGASPSLSSRGGGSGGESHVSKADFETVREAVHDLQLRLDELEEDINARLSASEESLQRAPQRLAALEEQLIDAIEDVAANVVSFVETRPVALADGDDSLDDISALMESTAPVTLRTVLLAVWRIVAVLGSKTSSLIETTDEAVSRLAAALHFHDEQLSRLGIAVPLSDSSTDAREAGGDDGEPSAAEPLVDA